MSEVSISTLLAVCELHVGYLVRVIYVHQKADWVAAMLVSAAVPVPSLSCWGGIEGSQVGRQS
jgi:hypothetical protein